MQVKDIIENGNLQIPKMVQDIVNNRVMLMAVKVNKTEADTEHSKNEIKKLESMIAGWSSAGTQPSSGYQNKKVLIECNVINNLTVMASEKMKFKEWNDKLVNAISQFRSYARVVMKLMRSAKDKEHERSSIDVEMSKETFAVNSAYDYDKFNE